MQAIQAKFYGPGNVRGSRWKVWSEAGVKWYAYDYSQKRGGPHEHMTAYAESLDWAKNCALHFGTLPNGDEVLVLEERK